MNTFRARVGEVFADKELRAQERLVLLAWLTHANQYAVHLREQTALLEKELVARVEASKDGRALGPSTLAAARSAIPLVAVGAVMAGIVGWAWWRSE